MINSIAAAANVLHELAFNDVLEAQIETGAERINGTYWRGGSVIATGMGKAGHIARKFAATLSSCGVAAHYVHPGEAAHGDLGQIKYKDIVIAFSTSGKTAEVLDLLDHLVILNGPKPYTTIGITSHGLPVDVKIRLPVMKEADPNNLVPTTSTTVMLAVSDALALRAVEKVMRCGDTVGAMKKVFAARHHGGYLGEVARDENTAFLRKLVDSGVRRDPNPDPAEGHADDCGWRLYGCESNCDCHMSKLPELSNQRVDMNRG